MNWSLPPLPAPCIAYHPSILQLAACQNTSRTAISFTWLAGTEIVRWEAVRPILLDEGGAPQIHWGPHGPGALLPHVQGSEPCHL